MRIAFETEVRAWLCHRATEKDATILHFDSIRPMGSHLSAVGCSHALLVRPFVYY